MSRNGRKRFLPFLDTLLVLEIIKKCLETGETTKSETLLGLDIREKVSINPPRESGSFLHNSTEPSVAGTGPFLDTFGSRNKRKHV